MSINDTIRKLDDAREHYKRIKGYDKLARKLILGALAMMTGSTALGIGLDNGNVTLMIIPAMFALGVGIWFWLYVNMEGGGYYSNTNRVEDARDGLRKAERAHEEAMMGGAS